MNRVKKAPVIVALLAVSVSMVVAPSCAWADAGNSAPVVREIYDVNSEEIRQAFRAALIAQGIDVEALDAVTSDDMQGASARGGGAVAAKIAVKAALKKMTSIGRKAWDETIEKLPVPGVVKKFIMFDPLLRVFNSLVNVSDAIEGALARALENIGVPSWLSGVAAKAVLAIVL